MELYLSAAPRSKLDPILDASAAAYLNLDEEGQVGFKGRAKSFVRTYRFLSSILPYSNADWEKLSIFLDFLILKLPVPREEDLTRGILETIDMDSYRAERRAAIKIGLPDQDVEIEPVPTAQVGHKVDPTLDVVSNIIKTFNDLFGNVDWTDRDRIERLITRDIPDQVANDTAYRNAMKNNDEQNARIEHDQALSRVMNAVMKDDTELFKQFSDNDSFRRWLQETVFDQTYEAAPG